MKDYLYTYVDIGKKIRNTFLFQAATNEEALDKVHRNGFPRTGEHGHYLGQLVRGMILLCVTDLTNGEQDAEIFKNSFLETLKLTDDL